MVGFLLSLYVGVPVFYLTYSYMRFRWGEGHDMDALMEELSEGFSVKRRDFPGNEVEVSLFKEDRVELDGYG